MSVTPGQLAKTALDWEKAHVPYTHRGTRRTGCDCTGLIIGCLQELGLLEGYRLRYYPRDWNLHNMGATDDFLQTELRKVADPVERKPQSGDIVLFRFGKCVAHCGIAINEVAFVHSHVAAKKVTIALFRTAKWAARICGVWQLNFQKLEAYHG